MNEDHLRERLETLHAELDSGAPLDDETRALLRQVVDDIGRVLAATQAAGDGGTTPAEHQSLAQRLRDATWNLEETHPRLTAAVGELLTLIEAPFQ